MNYDFYSAYTYVVQIASQNSAGKVVFYGWNPRNLSHLPLGTTRSN